ncbi:MAG: hypothetical protein AWU57_627 [Marinobacter sp. T13-3]|nr:MAG: hypothetical protein AWU57_627 [Marinobacter sp. T13-3]
MDNLPTQSSTDTLTHWIAHTLAEADANGIRDAHVLVGPEPVNGDGPTLTVGMVRRHVANNPHHNNPAAWMNAQGDILKASEKAAMLDSDNPETVTEAQTYTIPLGPTAPADINLEAEIRDALQAKVSERSEQRKDAHNKGNNVSAAFHEGSMKTADQLACDIPRLITATRTECGGWPPKTDLVSMSEVCKVLDGMMDGTEPPKVGLIDPWATTYKRLARRLAFQPTDNDALADDYARCLTLLGCKLEVGDDLPVCLGDMVEEMLATDEAPTTTPPAGTEPLKRLITSYQHLLRSVVKDIRDDLQRGGMAPSWESVADNLAETLQIDCNLLNTENADNIQEVVLAAIAAERRRQDDKWGGAAHDDELSPDHFVQRVQDYAGWARVMAGMNSPHKYRRRMIQVAAIATAAVESHDRQAKE